MANFGVTALRYRGGQPAIFGSTNRIMNSSLRRCQFGFDQELILSSANRAANGTLYFLPPISASRSNTFFFYQSSLGPLCSVGKKPGAFTVVGVGLIIALSTATCAGPGCERLADHHHLGNYVGSDQCGRRANRFYPQHNGSQ